MAASNPQISQLLDREYPAGFVTDIDADSLPPGLSEGVVRLISARKQEPPFLLDWRLKAYRHWQSMPVPEWSSVHYPPIDYNAISYYSSPKSSAPPAMPKSHEGCNASCRHRVPAHHCPDAALQCNSAGTRIAANT